MVWSTVGPLLHALVSSSHINTQALAPRKWSRSSPPSNSSTPAHATHANISAPTPLPQATATTCASCDSVASIRGGPGALWAWAARCGWSTRGHGAGGGALSRGSWRLCGMSCAGSERRRMSVMGIICWRGRWRTGLAPATSVDCTLRKICCTLHQQWSFPPLTCGVWGVRRRWMQG